MRAKTMLNSHSFVKCISLLCVIQLSVILVGCDGSPYKGPGGTLSEASVTASVHEGFNPLDVTFNVSGLSGVIADVTWDFGDGETAATTGNSSMSHTFITPGKVTVLVTINDRTSTSGALEFRIPLTVLPDVNLVVSSFAIDAETTPGGQETVSAIIQNIGSDSLVGSGHIDVGYYLSMDDNITVDDIYIGDTSIVIGDSFTQSEVPFGFESLSPGENYQYDHQLFVKGNIPAGTYFVGAIVDYIDEYDWYTFPRSTDSTEFAFPTHAVVAETNEEDNVRLLPLNQLTLTLGSDEPTATIFFTTDDTDPVTSPTAQAYVEPFLLTVDATVRSYATAPGFLDSTESSASFIITAGGGGMTFLQDGGVDGILSINASSLASRIAQGGHSWASIRTELP